MLSDVGAQQSNHPGLRPNPDAPVEIPKGFSAPIYPKSMPTVVSAPASGSSAEGVVVVLKSKDSTNAIVSYYKQDLAKNGWKLDKLSKESDGTTLNASNSRLHSSLQVSITDNIDWRVISLSEKKPDQHK